MTDKKPRNPDVDFGFHAQIPRLVRTGYRDLTPVQKWLYTCLKDLCGDHGTCYRTVKVLAEETGISTGMISESIPVLHSHGLIHGEKKKRHTGGKEVWHITVVDIWQANAKAHPTKRSHSEQTLANVHLLNENVHTVNENVHSVNDTPLERSVGEHKRSLCETEALPLSNNSNEALPYEGERAASSDAFTPADFLPENNNHSHHDASVTSHRAWNCEDWCNRYGKACEDYQTAINNGWQEAETDKVPVVKPPLAIASTPDEAATPLAAIVPQSVQGPDGAAAERSSGPRASRRRKPPQLTEREKRLITWLEELRGIELDLSRRDVTAIRSLSAKKGTDDKETFLNVVAVLDIDPWFEEHKVGVDFYWIDRQWENKYMFLQRKKPKAALDDSARYPSFDDYVGNGPEERKRWREKSAEMKALGFSPDL